uniref:Uncharacterized protein n=1 Tax=Pseudonaja textilis TaxID=8673 RepID=A0A670ZXI0_PSETE
MLEMSPDTRNILSYVVDMKLDVGQKYIHGFCSSFSKPLRLRDMLFSVSPDSATCDSEEVCRMFWFVPMPFMNGSVMHRVLVKSNGLGIPVYNRMFDMNIHGFMEPSDLYRWRDVFSLNDPSRPLWATYRQAPVLILGGIPEKKIVVISDTNFDTYDLIEVNREREKMTTIKNCNTTKSHGAAGSAPFPARNEISPPPL